MNVTVSGRHRSLLATACVAGLLCFSFILATPLKSAESLSTGSQEQVVPTVLSGYKSAGTLTGSTPVLVTIGIPLENIETLQYLTQQISTPGSPLYHHFLTSTQIQEFLPVSQYESALASLTAAGLKVVSSSLDSVIVAQGTASQVSQAFGLKYEVYTDGSNTYYTSSGTSPVPGAYLYSSNVTAVLLATPPDLASSPSGSQLAAASPSQSQVNNTETEGEYTLPQLQSVYNATSLYAAGDNGAGYTVGVLDFYGDPYIAQQLQYFDEVYGLPTSPFKVTAIGPYNPSLGTTEGWTAEISLDVESVHSMAPGASIDLYIANAALPLASIIAAVDQQDVVNDVTQSWGYPEGEISEFGPTGLALNVVLTDDYYMLGSAEGITFIGSTGDLGGSGNSAGPEGTVSYPASSPYVTSVGGTTTYLTFSGNNVTGYDQTAWSSTGDPDYEGSGGSTGGVSILEPLPWYQSGLTIPASYPTGRMNPEISLNANVFPAVSIILPGNVSAGYGGTSESNQLFGGLLTLVMAHSKTSLGLLNPTLYSWGNNPSISSKVYDPITFGYNIPWVATSGYNLVTGFGAPNIGEMAHYISAAAPASLGVNVSATVNDELAGNVLPGQVVSVSAVVSKGSSLVTSGTFTAVLDTLTGAVATAAMTYQASAHLWTGTFTVPQDASGIAYVTVSGTSGTTSGSGFYEVYAGYVATYLSPAFDEPYSDQFGIPLDVNVTTLAGVPATGTFDFTASTYSLQSNTYTKAVTTSVTLGDTDFGRLWAGTISGNYSNGAMVISGDGDVFGYLPFINGVGMQDSYIEPTVFAEPGVVAPGQAIYMIMSLLAPVNTPNVISGETDASVSYNVELGSNVTASLVSQSGKVVAHTTMYTNSFFFSEEAISGYMIVPTGIQPGLYNILFDSSYNSPDLDTWINGSYFGQMYVAPALSTLTASVTPSTVYEGQTVTVNAKIDYANGTAVKYGLYSATIYPNDLQNDYAFFFEENTFMLNYDSSTGLWTGNVTLPSAYNGEGTTGIDQGALYLSGPYDIFITGISADGVPSSTAISTQVPLQIQPYLYVGGTQVASLTQSSGVVFSGDTIDLSGAGGSPNLTGDLFIGSNTIKGSVTISDSQIQGTLNLQNADVTLIGVTGGSVVATNSKVILEQSSLGSLRLTGSQVSMNASVVEAMSPPLPTVSIQSPVAGSVYSGDSGNFTVSGQDVGTVSVYLDGTLLKTYSGAASYSVPLAASSMTVGVHTLQVIVAQQDGLSTSSSVAFSTDGPLVAANNTISALNTSVGTLNSQVSSQSSEISSQSGRISSLDSQLNTADDVIYVLVVVAFLALIMALVAVARRPKQTMQSEQPQTSPPASPPPAPTETNAPVPQSGPGTA